MEDPGAGTGRAAAAPSPAWRRTGLVLALLVVLLDTGLCLLRGVEEPGEEAAAMDEAVLLHSMAAEAFDALREVSGNPKAGPGALHRFRGWRDGTSVREFRFAILAALLDRPRAGTEVLDAWVASARAGATSPREGDAEVFNILRRTFADPAGVTRNGLAEVVRDLPPADAGFLRENLGWFGRLAVEPGAPFAPGSMDRVGSPLFVDGRSPSWAGLLAMGLVSLGFLTILALPVLVLYGTFRPAPSPPLTRPTLLLEAAAVVILGMHGLLILSFRLPESGAAAPVATVIPALAILLAPAWLRFRGAPRQEILPSLGWNRGGGWAKEAVLGACAYPLCLLIQFLTSFLLPDGPWHADPLDTALAMGPSSAIAAESLAGVVTAPLLEEVLFRGLLYRWSREATRHWGGPRSVGFAVLLSGVLFTIGHGGGVAALAGILAYGAVAALLYEWRGSLVAPIALHAVMNGAASLFQVLHGP
ncbi:MAG: CPBP family intramembrane metalloprotease [Planctomycetes bacterium]|nr:CPBP family intramembrane metalloprotease [Planctomycetota bacterium]